VVVPTSSAAYSFEDLKGKRVSVPFGSAAHGMLLKALIDRGLSQDYFTLINQAPPVGATSIQEKKIDAHADFCPWGELLEFRGWGRKILDGSDTKVPYLHGVVVRQDFAEKYPEIVVAYLKAVIEAGEWVTENPHEAAKAMQEWATINKEVMYLYFGPGGFLTLDTTMKPRWIETLKYDVTVLQHMGLIKQMDVDAWMNDTYLKQAYKETGRDYDQQLAVTSIGTVPVSGTDAMTGQPVADPRLAGEIWTAEDCILTYSSPVSLLVALRTLEQQGQGVQAAYAFDYASGLKLFANQAFYVLTAPGSGVPASILPFATKQAAEAFAAQHGGQVVNLDQAKQAAAL
jgi:NitT/TauT family transport system substrate-binding protein